MRQLLDVYSSDYGVIYREHIKNDWNQLTNRTKENFDKFTDSRKRVSVFRSKGQLYVLDLGPGYLDLEMDSVRVRVRE